ncbi:hypothetical protein G7Z17_g341 [Cylindrodendrum hubeiense]|uniref:Uncharacterized protein n=1 Tax=Cylindrodendrum hubeiense TaxID=595255 RepID=A0A9P5LMJ6_9HYPO|nr:hypothetical protein G7Z17_g341 [Cylindrodendrum hubeiense]
MVSAAAKAGMQPPKVKRAQVAQNGLCEDIFYYEDRNGSHRVEFEKLWESIGKWSCKSNHYQAEKAVMGLDIMGRPFPIINEATTTTVTNLETYEKLQTFETMTRPP